MIAMIWCGLHLLSLVVGSPSNPVFESTASSSCIASIASAFVKPWKIGLVGYRKRDARSCSIMSSSVDSPGDSNRFSINVDGVPTRLKIFIDNAKKEYPDNPLPLALSVISSELEKLELIYSTVEDKNKIISMRDDEIQG